MPAVAPGWATLRAHKSTVRALGFTENGQYLISGDDEGFCVFWCLDTRRPLAIWQAHNNALLTTKFWDWGDANPLVVTHGRDNKLRIWRNPLDCSQDFLTAPLDHTNCTDLPRPWLVYTQDINALNFCMVALSPFTGQTGLFAAPATVASERIDVYELNREFQVSRPFKELNAADAVPFEVQLEEEATAQQNRGQLGVVMALEFADQYLIAGYESGHVAAFDKSSGDVFCLAQPHKSPLLSLTTVGECVWTTAADRSISCTNIRTGETRQLAVLAHKGVASISNCPQLDLAVTAGWDGHVRLFSTANGKFEEVEAFKGGRLQGITTVRISALVPQQNSRRRLREPPSGWVAVAGKDSRIALHAVSKPHTIASITN